MAVPIKLFLVVQVLVAVVLLNGGPVADAFVFDRKSCGAVPSNNYAYDESLAKRMMAYSASAYVKHPRILQDWTCTLCKSVLKGFQPFRVIETDDLLSYMGYDSTLRMIVVVFRGTVGPGRFTAFVKNWILNASFKKVKPTRLGLSVPGEVHDGFYNGYVGMQTQIISALQHLQAQHPRAGLYVTGHSLGAALATIATMDFYSKGVSTNPIMINFGSPRVGDKCFAKYFSEKITRSIRVVHSKDIVTHVPPEITGYQHVSREVQDKTTWDHRVYLGYRGISARRRK